MSPLLTVGEVISALQRYPPDTRVRGTWETTTRDVDSIYITADGIVLIDVDEGTYREIFEVEGRSGES